MALFEVCAKCGHVGRRNYVEKIFAVHAENGKMAAKLAREIPRVKHHHKDAIISVKRIDQERYNEIIEQNDADNYFRCKSVQEQKLTCELDILEEPNWIDYRYMYEDTDINDNGKIYYDGKTKIRNPQRYYKYHQNAA